MKAKDVEYRIVCAPDTRDVERVVNEILEGAQNADVEFSPFIVAEKYERGQQAQCPKCKGRIEKSKSSAQPYICADCARTFTPDELEKATKTVFTRAGNFFIQRVILLKG